MTDFNWTATFGEVKTAAQWTDLGDNDRALQDGTGISNGAIKPNHLLAAASTANNWSMDSFTPNWTSSGSAPAIGNGTFTGKYLKIGRLVFLVMSFVGGSSTTWGTGSYYIDYPVTPDSIYNTTSGGWDMSGYCEDNGSVAYHVVSAVTNNTTKFQLTIDAPQSSTVLGWGNTAPFTWATGDFWMASGFYLAAS